MPSFRKEKIGEAIRKVISDKIIRESSPIPNAFVTINRVDLTSDLRLAKIFYSIFGSNIEEKEAKILMQAFCSESRYEISQKLNLNRTPKIEFCFDKNIEYASKINQLLG